MRYIVCVILLSAVCTSNPVMAQKDRNQSLLRMALKGLEYEIKGGISIGGTAPLPLPVEIRDIKKYKPGLAFSLQGSAIKWFDNKWGMAIGVRLETKTMKAEARVKNYSMELVSNEGGYMKGRWTGDIRTNVDNSYVTFPLTVLYRLGKRVRIKAGLYASYLLEGMFSGTARNGYLREKDPTGIKYTISEASYDFSENLRKWSWGATVGTDWQAFRHLMVFGDLNWGLNGIFRPDFKTITFDMFPIYLNVGFGYSF